MKLIKYLLFILLPVIVFAQASDSRVPFDKQALEKAAASEGVELMSRQGCVLAIHGDSVNFEEYWIRFPAKTILIISPTNEPIAFEDLKPPFWAEITWYDKNQHMVVKSLQVLSPLKYDANGCVSNLGEGSK